MSAAPFFDWASFPSGVKFEPTDTQLLQHLTSKVQEEESKAKEALGLSPRAYRGAIPQHPLIAQFVPTLNCDDGICGVHPEDLPGISKEGITRHYFHRPSRAYSFGSRKRRKIQSGAGAAALGADGIAPVRRRKDYRWHKTGKTRPVLGLDKRQLGWKKILVLYETISNQFQNASKSTTKYRKGTPEASAQAAASKGGEGGASRSSKDRKTNWIMHQYHLGPEPEEREGEWVVAKVFYQVQQRQSSRGTGAAREDVPEAASAGAAGLGDEGEEEEEGDDDDEEEEEEEEEEEDAEGAGVVVEEDDIEEGSDGERDYQRGKGRTRGSRGGSSLRDAPAVLKGENKRTDTSRAQHVHVALTARASLANLIPTRGGVHPAPSLGAPGAGPSLGLGIPLKGHPGLQEALLGGVQELVRERTTPHRPIALRHGTRLNDALLRLSKAQAERPGIPGPLWSGVPQARTGPTSSSSAPQGHPPSLGSTTLGLSGRQTADMAATGVPGGAHRVQQGATFMSVSARGSAPAQVSSGRHALPGPASFGAPKEESLTGAVGPAPGAPVVRPVPTRGGLPGASLNSAAQAEAGRLGTSVTLQGNAANMNLTSSESLEESAPAPDCAALPGDSASEPPHPRGAQGLRPVPVEATEGQWVLVSSTEYSKGLCEDGPPSVHLAATKSLGAPINPGRDYGKSRAGLAAGGQETSETTSRQGHPQAPGRAGAEHSEGLAREPEASTTSSPEDPEFAEGMLLTPPEDNTMPVAAAARGQEGPAVAAKQGTSQHMEQGSGDAPGVGSSANAGKGTGTGAGAGAGAREKGFSQLLGEVMMGFLSPPPPGSALSQNRQVDKGFGSGIQGCTNKNAHMEGEETPQVLSHSALQSGEAKGPKGAAEVGGSAGNSNRNSNKESPPQETDTEPQILTSQDFPSLGEDSAGMPKGIPTGLGHSSGIASPLVGPSQGDLGSQPGSQFVTLSQGQAQGGGQSVGGVGPSPGSLGFNGSQPLGLHSSQPLSLSQPGAITPLFSSQELRDLEAPPEDTGGMPDASGIPRVGLGLGLGQLAHRGPGSIVGTQESVELEPLRLSQGDAPVLSSQECRDLGTIFCSPPHQGLGHAAGGPGQGHAPLAGAGKGKSGGRSPADVSLAHQAPVAHHASAAVTEHQPGSAEGEGDGQARGLAGASVDPLAGGFFREEDPSALEGTRENLGHADSTPEARNLGPGGGFLPPERETGAHPEVRARDGPVSREEGDEGGAGREERLQGEYREGSGLDVLAAVMVDSSGKGSGKGRGGKEAEEEASHTPSWSPAKTRRASPLRASRGTQRNASQQSNSQSTQQGRGPPLVRRSPGKGAKAASKAGGEMVRPSVEGQQRVGEALSRGVTGPSPRKALLSPAAEKGPLLRGRGTGRDEGSGAEGESGEKGGGVGAGNKAGKKGGHVAPGPPGKKGRRSEENPGRVVGQRGGREYWRNVVSMDE